ncbi:MAG: branched-chain amino acid ABC transporter permease, partial [Rhodospirillaceae bacterium]|nr:branched-chain amino acid ABC transporter permease [Rhodospirillaceae bacterium]
NEFYFLAIYMVMQAMIMGTAWNILGGFTGYVNFGSAGFFAMGAYIAVALDKAFGLPLIFLVMGSAVVCGLIGLAAGYLTLRLRGVYFAIATLAMAIVLETLVVHWEYVGGAAGAYLIPPEEIPIFDNYIEYMFVLMLVLTIGSVAVSRYINISRFGRGLAAIRDDEVAAECAGVPTLKLKLVSTTTMGAMMGVAGAPFPFFIAFVDPISAFNLLVAVNAIAIPLIGGKNSWVGPVIGALLLGTTQQIVTVTISSELNILVVGVMLVMFVALAPEGIVGLYEKAMAKRKASKKTISEGAS